MLIKDFFQAFSAGKELTNGATWKNTQLVGSKLAILLGALLAIANAFGQPASLCAAGAGIGGHMAARLLFILERLIEQKLKKVAS